MTNQNAPEYLPIETVVQNIWTDVSRTNLTEGYICRALAYDAVRANPADRILGVDVDLYLGVDLSEVNQLCLFTKCKKSLVADYLSIVPGWIKVSKVKLPTDNQQTYHLKLSLVDVAYNYQFLALADYLRSQLHLRLIDFLGKLELYLQDCSK